MSGEAWLYLLAVLINAVNLFLQVFFTIMYSDLEWSVGKSRDKGRALLLLTHGSIVTISIRLTSATASTPTSFLKLPFTHS
jgi:hypothetical protein